MSSSRPKSFARASIRRYCMRMQKKLQNFHADLIVPAAQDAGMSLDEFVDPSCGRYRKLLHELISGSQGPRWDFIPLPADRVRHVQFKSMPSWRRAAALLLNFVGHILSEVDCWDATALCSAAQAISKQSQGKRMKPFG
jgi:hypothetical protein